MGKVILSFIVIMVEVTYILKENIKKEKKMEKVYIIGKENVHQFIKLLKVYLKMT